MTMEPPKKDPSIALLYTTIDCPEKAKMLAQKAVEEKHAMCVNFIPGHAVYLWQDTIQCEEEWFMLFKTSLDRLDALKSWVLNHHPYDIPAVLTGACGTTPAFHGFMEQCGGKF